MDDALYLSQRDLQLALDAPSVLAALQEAFRSEHRREWDTPRRIAAHTRAGALLAMPCGAGSPEALGAKLVTTFPGNRAAGLPSVNGLYALFDPETGVLQSIMDGGYLTLVRTAAVSALATRWLARDDASTLGILGAGAQAGFHARLIAAVRPIDTVKIWARGEESAKALVASLKSREELVGVTSWVVCAGAQEAAGCDVVVTATSAAEPVLRGQWLAEGAHLNAIGAHTKATRELDAVAVGRASTLVVETADTLLEAGDFQMAEGEEGGVIGRVETLASLIDPDRTLLSRSPRAISIFKSCGVAFEDLAVAALAFRHARSQGLGTCLRLPDKGDVHE